MKGPILISCLLAAVLPAIARQRDFPTLTGPYLGQTPPGTTPTVFAPGIISTEHHEHSAPTFSPDGHEVYWSVFLNGSTPQVILSMKEVHGRWSKPALAEFSGTFSDGGPSIAPDGKRLFFDSNRPVGTGDTARSDPDIWMMEKSSGRWGEPTRIGTNVNSPSLEGSPSVSANGNLFFLSDRNDTFGEHDIYYTQLDHGRYGRPVNLGSTINSKDYEDYPFIAEDERYLLFCGSGREDGLGLGDLYISFKQPDGEWGEPINLGDDINSRFDDRFPMVSPDNKYLFFVSDRSGNSDIYWVDASIIEELQRLSVSLAGKDG